MALIPSVEYIRHAEYEIVSDACVATDGPVLSVMLYSRVPLHEIAHLALVAGSRSSAALVRILLAEQFRIHPEIEQLPLSYSIERSSADAVLLIGDRALHRPEETFCVSWDLGAEWFRQTSLPFVFACWVRRKNRCPEHVSQALNSSRDWGVKHLQQIAQATSRSHSIDSTKAYRYLKWPSINNQVVDYRLADYSELKNLPYGNNGNTHSMFNPNNDQQVYGAERLERYIFWVIGTDDAGHPRRNDQILLHFDQSRWKDPALFNHYLRLPPEF